MPLAPVDNEGTQLYYEDTGVVPTCPNYRTLVLIHGGIFNGATFRPLFPYAGRHGLRLVTVNMRDYFGSTPYSPSELAVLGSTSPQQQRSVVYARGLEVAAFLAWFIRKENIPPPSHSQDYGGTPGGGLALLGWSWGNNMTISMLAQAAKLPPPDRLLLGAYLRTLIIFDSARYALGVPETIKTGVTLPSLDPKIPMEEKAKVFQHLVSGYYCHSPSILVDPPALSLEEFQAGLAHSPIVDPPPEHVSTVERVSSEVLAHITDSAVMARSHRLYNAVNPAVYKENVDAALRDASIWPKLKVSLIWCDMSLPETLLAAWYIAKEVKEDGLGKARKIGVIRFEGANHFPHWDQPERTIQLFADTI